MAAGEWDVVSQAPVNAGAWDVVAETAHKVPLSQRAIPSAQVSPEQARNRSVMLNAGNEAVAGIPDMFLNAPVNAWNLGKAAFGTAATAMGHPDLAPELTQPPNYARRGLEATGFIKPEWAPQTPDERLLAAGTQGAVGGGLGGVGGAALGATSGLLGQRVTEATGNPNWGTAAGMAVYPAANAAAGYGSRQVALADAIRKQKAPMTETLNEVRNAGYVTPPSEVNPGIVNWAMENIGGKAATRQEASVRNEATTNALARKGLGLPADAPLSDPALETLSSQRAQPYRDVAALPSLPSSNPHNFSISGGAVPAQVLDELKKTRFDATLHWREFNRAGSVDAYKAAQAADFKAADLEKTLENAADRAGRPDLVERLRGSRTDIAKIHDVSRALNTERGEVSALDLAKALNAGKPLTGELLTIAKMGNAYPKAVQRPQNVGSPDVSNLGTMVGGGAGAAIGALLGGPAEAGMGGMLGTAAIPSARILARKIMMSPGYQRSMATPNYNAGNVSQGLAQLPQTSQEQAALRSYLLAQQLRAQTGQ